MTKVTAMTLGIVIGLLLGAISGGLIMAKVNELESFRVLPKELRGTTTSVEPDGFRFIARGMDWHVEGFDARGAIFTVKGNDEHDRADSCLAPGETAQRIRFGVVVVQTAGGGGWERVAWLQCEEDVASNV